MIIFVLFERKTYGNGDCILAVSTSERKIKKNFNLEIEKSLKNGLEEGYRTDTSFLGTDNHSKHSSFDVELMIERHETI